MGTMELKAVLQLAFSAGELLEDLTHGVKISELGKLVEIAREVGPGLHGAAAALQEYAAMSDAEAVDLEAFAVKEFDLQDDGVEAGIEGALKIAIELHGLAKLLLPKAVA